MKTTRDNRGFTLIEVMVAIGIFAVGVVLVATTFPAAMLENKESSDHMLGALITENALAICRTTYRYEGEGELVMNTSFKPGIAYKNQNYQHYPFFDTKSRYGWLVAARRMTPGANDFQYAIVAYRKFDVKNSIHFETTTVTGNTITGAKGALGSPVINAATGKFAKLVGSKTSSKLNISPGDGAALVVRNPDASADYSPAFFCLIVRTSMAHSEQSSDESGE